MGFFLDGGGGGVLNFLNLLKFTYQQILSCMFAAFSMFSSSWPVNLKMDRKETVFPRLYEKHSFYRAMYGNKFAFICYTTIYLYNV